MLSIGLHGRLAGRAAALAIIKTTSSLDGVTAGQRIWLHYT